MDTYEKKYNEAMERAKKVHRKYKNLFPEDSYSEDIEEIFPELAESEDERIRKMCIAAVNIAASADGGLLHSEASECLAWLEEQKDKNCLACDQHLKGYIAGRKATEEEKQKEPKKTDLPAGFYFIDLDGNKYYSKEFRYGDMKLKVKEQKPAECIEDSVKFEEGFKTGRESGLRDGQKYVLDNAESYGLCKPAEWSEEDTLMLTAIIQTLERFGGRGTTGMQIDWLKSLRPGWKPSEEQMNALNFAITYFMHETNYKNPTDLRELYDDLLKLK